jgi:hypothetical protein
MVYAMDTLGYAKRLRDAGIPPQQAEAHAEAARDFVMAELVTKSDLQTAVQATKSDLQSVAQAAKSDLQSAVQLLEAKIDAQTLRLTVRLGGLLAAGIALLTAIQKLT